MTVKECYDSAGADYNDALERFGSEALIKKFSVKFLDDKSFLVLSEAIADKDAEKAFQAAHTLKGVAANLSFTSLYEADYKLTEKLRGRALNGYEELYEAVVKEYDRVVKAIETLKRS